MEQRTNCRAIILGFTRLVCFISVLVSLSRGSVLVRPVPTPPPDGGPTSTDDLSSITPESDETQINQVLGNTGSQIILGDIISDAETLRFITQDPRSRNAITYPHGLWPSNTVPYIIDSSIGKQGVQAIDDAIKDYHKLTCVKFVGRTTQKNYVRFTVGTGCSSTVGRRARGEQTVNLHQYCWSKGIVIHEMAHAIGFFHEQSRSDRDSYVRIMYENIKKGRESNFDKFSKDRIQHLGEPYDYGSIMHYGPYSFSSNQKATIVALKGGSSEMGQRKALSANDIRQINRLYKCPQKPVKPGPNANTVVYCNFDSGTPCDFIQDTTDDFDWTIRQGRTPSGGTGPSTDMSGRGWYIYTEASNPRKQGDRAVLLSPSVTGPYCLRMHFHMLGTNMGSLNAYKIAGSSKTTVFSTSGNKGDQWYLTQTSLTGSGQFQIAFEAVRGNGYSGDIALDEIKLTPGKCDAPTATTPSTAGSTPTAVRATTTPKQPSRREVYCNFDANSLCQFTQGSSDEFDWTLNKGVTSSAPDTGPGADVSSRGYYVYAEASFPRTAGDRAHLVSPRLIGDYCVQFYYHMYGNSYMGTLRILKLVGAQRTTVKTYSGNQGNSWRLFKTDISSAQNQQYQVAFEAERGRGWAGDIALDEIRLTPGNCRQRVTTTTTPPPPPPTTTIKPTSPQQQVYCNFDSGSWCGFTQDTGDNFDWTRHRGRTGSYPTTGPTNDYSGRGYYIYAEASSPRKPGDRARLLSPRLTGTHCVSLWYHMHGRQMGSLRLYGKVGSTDQLLWQLSGDQGNAWRGYQFRIQTSAQYQVVFEAFRGSGYQSDIALDDIRLIPGECIAANPIAPTTSIFLPTTVIPSRRVLGTSCRPGWSKHGTSCYKGFNDKLRWNGAKARCQKHGGYLVAINDRNEHNFVKSLSAKLYGDYAIWIGLRRDSTGDFSHWDNGEPITYTKWIDNEPSNLFGDENCAEMFRYSGNWLVTTCKGRLAAKHPFVCEIKDSPTEERSTGQCPSGWSKKGNACYRVYSSLSSRSWSQASSVCQAARANLVSITSANEQDELWGLIKAHSQGTFGFWIGLKRAYTNTFSWEDGSPMTYTNWLGGAPYNWGISEDCGYMSSITGGWLQSRCTRPLPFICKLSRDLPTSTAPTTPLQASCGIKPVIKSAGPAIGAIVGGKISSPGAWPWQAAILCKTCQAQDCGGTLVSAYHVVTAAHCVPNSNETQFIKNYKVRLGEHHFEKTEGYEQDIDIASVTIHRSYGLATGYDHDIAVIKLASPATINDQVGPVCLNSTNADFPPGTACYITGWGRTRHGGTISSVLREAPVPIVSVEDCRENYGRGGLITSNMLCAGVLGSGIDACQGDSGGPLVCEKDNRWYLVGTTSWGWGCAGQYYGVYTNIARQYRWIKANME